MTPVWVFDTNVIVSGLLRADSYPGRLLDLVVNGDVRLALDDRILAEYRDVIARPMFGIAREQQEAVIALFLEQEFLTAVSSSSGLPDPDDAMFLEVAQHTNGRVLITGNARHFPKRVRKNVEVISPREAWEKWVSISAG